MWGAGAETECLMGNCCWEAGRGRYFQEGVWMEVQELVFGSAKNCVY